VYGLALVTRAWNLVANGPFRDDLGSRVSKMVRHLTGVEAASGAMERAQAFACAHVQRAVLFDPLQLNAIR